MAVSPQQLATQFRTTLQSKGYVVGSDGTVRRNGAAVPPWAWAQEVPELQAQKVNVQGQQVSPYTLPPGFQESAWSGMAQSNGPFSKPAAWDQETGTYEAKPDWATIAGTAAVGGLFAAPAVPALFGGGGGTAAATGAGSSAGAGVGAGTSAATAAGGSGVASTAAGAGWFSPASLVTPIVSGIASIYGANQQANANSEAAQLQHQSTEEALKDARDQRAYQQQQYADYLGRLAPYRNMGLTAGSTLQNLLARSPYTRMANDGPLPQYSTAPQQSAPQPMQQSPASVPQLDQSRLAGNTGITGGMNSAGGQSLVTLRAPDGSQKQVDAATAQHYLSRGAVQV